MKNEKEVLNNTMSYNELINKIMEKLNKKINDELFYTQLTEKAENTIVFINAEREKKGMPLIEHMDFELNKKVSMVEEIECYFDEFGFEDLNLKSVLNKTINDKNEYVVSFQDGEIKCLNHDNLMANISYSIREKLDQQFNIA